jgi:hypothetical protein
MLVRKKSDHWRPVIYVGGLQVTWSEAARWGPISFCAPPIMQSTTHGGFCLVCTAGCHLLCKFWTNLLLWRVRLAVETKTIEGRGMGHSDQRERERERERLRAAICAGGKMMQVHRSFFLSFLRPWHVMHSSSLIQPSSLVGGRKKERKKERKIDCGLNAAPACSVNPSDKWRTFIGKKTYESPGRPSLLPPSHSGVMLLRATSHLIITLRGSLRSIACDIMMSIQRA